MSRLDWDLDQIMQFYPKRIKAFESIGYSTCIHYDFGNESYTLSVEEGEVVVQKGLINEAKCIISGDSDIFVAVEKGQKNAMAVLMTGELKVSNMMEMMKFSQHFYGLLSSKLKDDE